MKLDAIDDARLLAADDADGSAFAAFYRRHVDAVLGFLASEGVDATTAADVTAETFVAAVLARRRFDPKRGHARSWLLGIARHKLSDSRSRWVRDRRLQESLGMERIELSVDDVELYRSIYVEEQGTAMNALERLPERQQAAVRARVLRERSYDELSQELGMSEAAGRQNVSRGLAAIRRLLTIKGQA